MAQEDDCDLEDTVNYLGRYLLHGLVWIVTYLIVAALVLTSAAFFLYIAHAEGIVGSIIAWLWAILAGLYWAHTIACDLVPMGPDGEHVVPPRA